MLAKLRAAIFKAFGGSVIRLPRIAVFIDGDGVSPNAACKVLDLVSSQGQVCVVRTYGNFTGKAVEGWAKLIRNRGLVVRHMPSLVPGKNATDIALSIDTIEVLLTRKIDTFVLVASDADFTPLASRIRQAGKRVDVYGNGSTPESLRSTCTAFHDIRQHGLPISLPTPPAARWSRPPTDANELVLAALTDLQRSNELVLITALAARVAEREPGFDSRNYKRRSLLKILRELPSITVMELEGGRFACRRSNAA